MDLAHLQASARAVLARHEVSHTSLRSRGGHAAPVQVIDEDGPELPGPHDLSSIGAGDVAAALHDLLVSERSRLDPANGRGLLLTIAQLGATGSAIVITAHPTLADRRSLRLLATQIIDQYAGAAPPTASVQYADFASWHSELLAQEDRSHRREYWDRHLDPAMLARGSELLANAGRDCGGWRTTRVRLDDAVSGGVGELAAALGLGEDTIVATAWALTLWRLSGEQDLAITATVPARSFDELAAAVGPFARDLPVAVRFSLDESFQETVVRVSTILADTVEHADDLDPARMPTQHVPPGFEYIEAMSLPTLDDLRFTVFVEDGRQGGSLTLRAGRGDDGCWLELGHDDDALSPDHADLLLRRLQAVLAAGVATPVAPVGQISLLVPDEAAALVAEGIGPPVMSSAGQTLHGLILEQAAATPDALAVQDGRTRLSYAELAARSLRFARHLVAHGVVPGDRVCIYMERTADFLVCLLGIVRAGAAYVPVDVRQPGSRLAFIIDDVASRLLVTDTQPAEAEAPPFAVVRYHPDLDGPAVPSLDAHESDSLAYVMFTSGSTGVPNGVPVTHRALLNYLLWATRAYDLRAGSGALVHSSVGFDLTLTGLLAPLLVGQRVELVPETPGLDGLVAALRQAEDVTVLKVTPSQLEVLAHVLAMDGSGLGRVRTLVVGGEQLRSELLEPFRADAPGLRIVNEYGPTETVVGSCAYEVGPETTHTGPVPIGTPIAGTRVHLLDGQMLPVPTGVPGEIYIGGAGVASGYLARAELTSQRFLPDPFSQGETLYRTGDRARRLPSGDLVYLGRTDDQIKVRGVRVEPGEIEWVLRRHPRVTQAGVAVSGSDAEARLVAGVVCDERGDALGDNDPAPSDFIDFCRQELPEFLVPSTVVVLPSLPTTRNGKLDRAALAKLAADAATRDAAYASPRSETEEILAGAIANVLGREQVGIDDNYFILGGDSIRSVMVVSRAGQRGLELSVADLHRYPTVRELAQAIATGKATPEPRTAPMGLLTAEERALMPPDVEDAFPLNLLQEGMIFHRDFAAKSAVYHAIASVRLRAPFDLDAMRLVVRQLVERHPMLRTSFDLTTFGRPLQLVHRTFADPLGYEDLRGLDTAAQDARIEGWVESEKQRGFDLDEYPLIRFMAQRIDDETFQFTYGFHHEIVDGWSEALMVTELFSHYFSLVFGEPVELRRPTATMRDAVALELEALSRQENYDFWSRYLADATLMRLPRPDQSPSADKGAREIVRLVVPVSSALSDAAKRLAIGNAVPLKSVLLAAHMAVMHHYHGQPDTLTYTVTNGRPESADGSTAIGLFVNSLALRLRLGGGTWRELIGQTLEAERVSLPYRRLPMAELKRHQGNEPLAETLFFFTDYHVFRELERWRDYGVEHMASELYGESTFPFCAIFRLNRETTQLEVRIEYDSLQFPADLMDGIAACYVRVLEAMTADPDARYHTSSLLSTQERRRLLAWSQTGQALADPEPVQSLIARQVGMNPDAIAIEAGDVALSYAALDRRVDQVATALRSRGAGPETTVALLAGRSMEAVICLLGVLKAGAAYVPLDPAHPAERLRQTVQHAAPVVVLAEPAAAFVDHPTVLPVVPGLPWAPRVSTRLPPPALSPDHSAYVIYTSGSTGEPKGVVVTHRGLSHSTLARVPYYQGRPERFLLLSTLSFDSSVAGLFWPLCTGATLVVPPEGAQREPAVVAREVQTRQITHTLCVPSLLTAVLEAEPTRLQGLRTIIAAGEASSRELYESVRTLVPDSTFHNEYGPTENTVWSTVWSGQPLAHRLQLPIGRPVQGVRAYVLDHHGQMVPTGVAGDLCLGGRGLARGYAGRPALTAASFRPDPWAPEPGERMYVTGDLARFTPGGELEFLGRADHQVKIRGFRVELGEIEGVLDAHPDVHRSVVLATADRTGEKSLVAYVTARAGAAVDVSQLQHYTRDRLPKYMVPTAWMMLDELPLTATGKVDRRSLPAPTSSGSPSKEVVAPRTETEQVIAAIWSQVLDRGEISADDDFFDIGGESLRAMQVVTKTNQVFGVELSVRALFDASTVGEFAAVVQAARRTRQAVGTT